MAHPHLRRLAALGGCGVLALSLQAPARADLTYTRVTKPGGHAFLLDLGGSPTFAITGTTSSGVTQVNLYCVRGPSGDTDATLVKAGVAVTAGAFSTTAPIPDVSGSTPVCRLQALPQGVSPNDDITSFNGPVINIDTLKRTSDGTNTLDFRLTAGDFASELSVASAGKCGDGDLGDISAYLTSQSLAQGCVADLGGTVGSLTVDGHPALLPPEVLAYTNGTSPLSVTVTEAHKRLVWTESAPLMRCSGTDTYPPTSPGLCGSLVATGVSFQRQGTFGAGVQLRDSFVSTDSHRHHVHATYGVETTPPATGALGFWFPGRAGGFRGSSPGQVITGLPTRAATVLVSTDRFAAKHDPQSSTRAITWSRPPAKVAFDSGDASVFGMSYSLVVPKGGAVHLGFLDDAGRFAGRPSSGYLQRLVLPAPFITSPAVGATIQGRRTVVKGSAQAGFNGLPTSVTVNGHLATLTSSTAHRVWFRCVLDEAPGTHTLTAVSHDAGGNKTPSESVTVRNK